MTHRTLLGLLAAGALVAAPVTARAQGAAVAGASGLSLGLELSGNSIKGDDSFADGTDNGGGLGLNLGYGFRSGVSLVAHLNGASMTSKGQAGAEDMDYALAHFDLGARYTFLNPARKLAPFVELAFSGVAATAEDLQDAFGNTGDLELGGSGFTVGGGADYYLSPKVALGARLAFTSGKFTDNKFAGQAIDSSFEPKFTTTRLAIGLTWFPMAK